MQPRNLGGRLPLLDPVALLGSQREVYDRINATMAGRTVSRAPLKLHITAPEMTLLLTSWQEMDAAVAEAIAVTGRTGGTLRISQEAYRTEARPVSSCPS